MNQKETVDKPTLSSMHKLHRWRMAFFGLVILIAGFVIGGALMMIVAPHKLMRPPRGPEFGVLQMIPRLQDVFGLSPEQVEKIGPILKENMEQLDKIRDDARDQIKAALEQMNEQISEILTEEQLRIWKHSFSRLQRPFGPGGPRRGNGGPGPGRRRGQSDPNRPRKGPGPFGPGRRPEDPNRPRNGFDYDRLKPGPGPFGPGRPQDTNFPRRGFGPIPPRPDEESGNRDL